MKRKGALALLGTVVVVAALAAVGVVAYNIGVTNGSNGGHVVLGPMMRGYRGGEFGMGVGGWWWGIVPALLLGFVIVLVLAALLSRPSRPVAPAAPGPAPEGPSGLRELVEMHDRGALTEDEFAAAKRKLLGL